MKRIEADLTKHSYMVAIPCYDGVAQITTVNSLVETTGNLAKANTTFQFNIIRGGALIDAVRNELALTFLDSTCDTIVWIDSDISWKWEDFERLLVMSHHHSIVCGAYTCKVDPPKFLISFTDMKYNDMGLLPIDSMGFGFVAIQRRVFEDLLKDTPTYFDPNKQRDIPAFFRIRLEDGKYIGEDIHFFNEARKVGHQAWLDPNIQLAHTGLKTFDTPLSSVLFNKD